MLRMKTKVSQIQMKLIYHSLTKSTQTLKDGNSFVVVVEFWRLKNKICLSTVAKIVNHYRPCLRAFLPDEDDGRNQMDSKLRPGC